MRLVLCRQPSKLDSFTASLLKNWAQEDEDKTAECLDHFLSHNISTPKKVTKARSVLLYQIEMVTSLSLILLSAFIKNKINDNVDGN